jgi:hypothetical protein
MEQLEALVSEVRPLLNSGGGVDSGVLISVGVKLAVRVNALKELSGVQKRDLVVKVLSRALDNMKGEELKKVAGESSLVMSTEARYSHLQTVVKDAVPAAIDAAIDASRGKLNLKKIKPSVLVKYFSCFAATAISVLSASGAISGEDAKKADLVVRKVENVSLQVAEKIDVVVAAAAEKEESEPAPAPAEAAVVETKA